MVMNKILFLKSSLKKDPSADKDWAALQDDVADMLGSTYDVAVAAFSDLAFLADGKKSRVWNPRVGWDIADFDLVVFRRVGTELEKAISAAHYLKLKNVPFIDEYLLSLGKGKLAGSFLRTSEGIPVPRTFYAGPKIFKEIFAKKSIFTYPFILKADGGRKGRNNYLINSYKELCQRLDAGDGIDMVAQEFIRNDGDTRVLVLNGKARAAIVRKAKAGSHLNNTSAGGSAETLPIKKIPKKALGDCLLAAKVEQLQVAGVDLIISKETGKHYILEVNRAPQLATGAYPEVKLAAYSEMISEIMTANKVVAWRKPHIGRAEFVVFPELSNKRVSAKVDTGADSSSIHASRLHEDETGLSANILGSKLHFVPSHYTTTRVENSFGHRETRYKVKLAVKIKGRVIRGTFTLSNRRGKTYQVLLGRRLLAGKFIVDVKAGDPLVKKERLHSKLIQAELKRK